MRPLGIFLVIPLFLAVPHVAHATTFSILAHFNSTTGYNPKIGDVNNPPRGGRLIQAPDGNFYGTATDGGSLGYGTIFKISPAGTVTVMANFDNSTTGKKPYSIMRADDGNYYGTTLDAPVSGESTAFKMTPVGTLTTLANFNSTTGYKSMGIIQASDGFLYGTCNIGGTGGGGNGSFFKLTTAGALTTLFTAFNTTKGIQPFDTLVQAGDGNFYGTTYYGGASNQGSVFKMTSGGTLTTIRSLTSTIGTFPRAGLVLGSDGLLYGATEFGGSLNSGTIFKISTTGTLTTLVHFDGTNGIKPQAPPIQGSDGNFYGTTPYSSTFGTTTLGTIYKMTPAGTLATLMTFPSLQTSGRLLQGSDGSFYGTTDTGGTSNLGTAFRFNATSTENVTFHSAATVPITTTAYTITESDLNITLDFVPSAGVLTVVNNTGTGAISGRFTNLPDGGAITAIYNGTSYTFTANYAGGDGNDLTLSFSTTVPHITSASSTTMTSGLAGHFNVTATGNPAPTYSATGLPAWASLDSSTGLLGGTPPTAGPSSHPIAITATNGVAPPATQNFTLFIIAPFAQWKAQPGFFTTEQLADPAISGPTAAPQHDGYSNLLKYIFNINPARPMSSMDRTALPAMAIDTTTSPGTPFLTLTFRQYSLMTGTTIHVQTSTNLVDWNTVIPDLAGQTGTDANTGDPIMRVGVKTNDAPKLFMRFNVTQP